jgi:hypothetical protein
VPGGLEVCDGAHWLDVMKKVKCPGHVEVPFSGFPDSIFNEFRESGRKAVWVDQDKP